MPGVETPRSIAEVALLGTATAAPMPMPTADVVAYAKRDLTVGEALDGSGGGAVYGLIERVVTASARKLLPLGLAQDVRMRHAVTRDEPLTYDDVIQGSSAAWILRREQDSYGDSETTS